MNRIKISISEMYKRSNCRGNEDGKRGGGGGGETKSESILRAAVHCCI